MRKMLLALLSGTVVAGSAAAQTSRLSGSDRDYVIKVAKANNYELEAARLATSKAGHAELKAFADSMITGHSKIAEDLKAALMTVDSTLDLPEGVEPEGQARLDSLREAGPEFDAVYRQQMIVSLGEVEASLVEYGRRSGTHPTIKAVMQEALPVVRRHLNLARTLPIA